MAETIRVGIADFKLCKSPDTITTIGLGSCVGIVLYSMTSEWCGMLHIMLPSSKEISNNSNRLKFADSGLEDMIQALKEKNVNVNSLHAKIAGGATMFQFTGSPMMESIGTRNVKSVKDLLEELNIPLEAEDTGADYGRTIVFDPSNKSLIVRSAGKKEILL